MMRHLPLLVAVSLYLAVGFLLLPYYRYQINPDGISYINNARLLLQGELLRTVNNHWNPLISWLLAPFLLFMNDAHLAFKLMNLLIGAAGFFLLNCWLERLRINGWLRWLVLFILAPVLLWMAVSVNSPDLLVSLCLLFYLTLLYRPGYFERWGNAVGLGLAAGLAYLAKYYALPFIAVHLLVWHALEYRRQRRAGRRKVLRSYLIVMLIFIGVVLSWMGLQALKYGQFGRGHHTSGWIFSFIDPHEKEFPLERSGLVAPPYPGATSIWDDPHSLRVKPWSPWSSPADMAAYAGIVRGFFSYFLLLLGQFSPFAAGLLLIFFWFGLKKGASPLSRREAWQWLLPAGIYVSGYLLIWVEERYLWFLHLLLIVISLYLVRAWPVLRKSWAGRTVLLLLLLSFAYYPVEKLVNYLGRGRNYHEMAVQLQAAHLPTLARIASNAYWNESLYLCYYRGGLYYGSCTPYRDEAAVRAALQKHKIDYFLHWGRQPASRFSFLNACPELTGGGIEGLRLYDLRGLSEEAAPAPEP